MKDNIKLIEKSVTFFISSLGGGGAQNVCVTIANGLVNNGWNVTLLVMNLGDDRINLARLDKNIEVNDLQVKKARFLTFSLVKYFLNNNIKKIVCFDYELSIQTIIVNRVLNKKIKVISRNINSLKKLSESYNSFWRKYIVFNIIKMLYSKSDIVINQCQKMKLSLLQTVNIEQSKCKVIYNPIGDKYLTYKYKSSELSSQEYLLCVGRLEKQKAFDLAIEAFSKVAQVKPNLRLKILGTGSELDKLKILARSLNIAERVEFLGYVSDMGDYYDNAQCVLLTSLFEGFPNVLVESITFGTPIVSVDCESGPSEIVNDVNGILVNYNNRENIYKSIIHVLDNKYKYNKQAIKIDSKRFNISNIIKNWESVLS